MERPYKLKRINLESSNNLLDTKLVIVILAIKVTNEYEKYVLKKGRKHSVCSTLFYSRMNILSYS